MDKVVVITGPTAVGKTKLSIAIAQRLHTEIINGDAYQVYQKMDIGTAKPNEKERRGITHHLLSYVDPASEYSVADYQRDVRNCIRDLLKRKKIPLIVGGSGLYIDAVIKDYRFYEKKRAFDDSETIYQSVSNEELYRILQQLDSEVAKRIHPNNRKRVLRAIEQCKSPIEKDSRSHRNDYHYETLLIFLNDDRMSLYSRINQRVDEMIQQGLIDEVKAIGISGFSLTSQAAIGYKECLSYLQGEISLENMIELIKQHSRHYAKRQFTWFKNKTDAIVVDVNLNHFEETIEQVYNLILQFMHQE